MVTLFPRRLKSTVDLVRSERDLNSPAVIERSRSIVKIRNATIALGIGLAVWLPVSIVMQTPGEFFSSMIGYVILWSILAALTWYVVKQTRYHAMEVLEEISDRHPDETSNLADLLRSPWYVLVFGPWYKAMYLPAFASRWIGRAARSFIPKG